MRQSTVKMTTARRCSVAASGLNADGQGHQTEKVKDKTPARWPGFEHLPPAARGLRRSRSGWLAAMFLLAAGTVMGQTRIDLPSQSRRVDFSQASSTKPAKMGSALPGTCSVGELFYNSDASAGLNLYGCVAVNTWALLGNAYNGMATALGDVKVIRDSANQLTVGAGCSPATPCNVRIADTVYSYSTAMTATAPSGAGTVRVGIDSTTGTVVAWHNLASLSCGDGMNCVGATPSWPLDSFPLAECTVSSSSFDATGCQDRRAVFSRDPIAAGLGLQKTGNTISIGPTVQTFSAGTSAPPATCIAGEMYVRTSTNQVYACTTADTWTEVSGGDGLTDPGSNGLLSRTSSGTLTPRAVTAGMGMVVTDGDGVAGNPVVTVDGAVVALKNTAQNFAPGARQTFAADATTAGLAITPAADPSAPAAGDLNIDPSHNLRVHDGTNWRTILYYTAAPSSGDLLASTSGGASVSPVGSTGTGNVVRESSPAIFSPVLASSGPKPACDTTQRGKLWYTPGDAGVKDALEICAKDDTDTYGWHPVY